jgi:adenosylhomocysteine nucleosidase
MALLLIGCSIVLQCRRDIAQRPSENPILVLYAFAAEGKLIGEQMTVSRTDRHIGRTVLVGQISGKDIVLAESGVGTTNAAMTTQRMIDIYQPRTVVFTGIAGAIDTSVRVGDIVVADTWIEHDYGYVGADGFEPGRLSLYSPAADSLVRMTELPVDSALLAAANGLEIGQLGLDSIGARLPRLMVGGVGVTGNTFIDSREKRSWLVEKFSAMVTDMESAAVAQVCIANDMPFVVFRSASDLAGGSGSETAQTELDEFYQAAAGNASKVVMAYLARL